MVIEQALLCGLFLVIAAQRISELRLAKRNLQWALAQGGRLVEEPHYWMFFVLHTGWLLAWPLEAWLRGPALGFLWPLWLAAFVLAEGLRYWAIASLGQRWNTKIVVLEGAPLIRRGPYRFIAHPNYLAVALELACVPLIFGAWITALVCSVLNAALLLGLRIPAETAALRGAQHG
jgi:methyltransferase